MPGRRATSERLSRPRRQEARSRGCAGQYLSRFTGINQSAVAAGFASVGTVHSPFTLEGHGVRLEPLTAGHADGLAEAAAGDRATFAYTWVPDGGEDARRYVEAALAAAATGRAVPFAVRHLETDTIAGSTRFHDLDVFTWPPPWPPGIGQGPEPSDDQPPTVAEIGSTWYGRAYQRTGVNTACKLLMLAHAFETWETARVTLKTDARNKASRASIDRIGGRFEGVRRAAGPASDGTIRDTAYFSILAAEWPAVRDHLHRLIDERRLLDEHGPGRKPRTASSARPEPEN
jgi:RimJ/RimL family protein N-acetyltransferase